MKKIILLVVFALGATLATAAPMNDEAEYEKLMRKAGGTMRVLRNHIKSNDKKGIVRAAGDLEGIFKQDEKFWAKRKADGAVKLSKDAQSAVREILEAARKGESERTQTGLTSLNNACTACHKEHREVSAGGQMKIKG